MRLGVEWYVQDWNNYNLSLLLLKKIKWNIQTLKAKAINLYCFKLWRQVFIISYESPKTTSSRADSSDTEVLIQRNGDTEWWEKRHLPQLLRSQHWSWTVGPGVRYWRRGGQQVIWWLCHYQIWNITDLTLLLCFFNISFEGKYHVKIW